MSGRGRVDTGVCPPGLLRRSVARGGMDGRSRQGLYAFDYRLDAAGSRRQMAKSEVLSWNSRNLRD